MKIETRPTPLSNAALAGALFTVLAFQELRFEGYETEKSALLLIFGLVVLAGWVADPGGTWARIRQAWNAAPMAVSGVLLLVLVAVVSTPFALSPARSVFGATDRGQGVLITLVYGVLFLQAVMRSVTLLKMLPPILTLCAVVMGVYSLLIYTALDVDRPGSTTGNPNYIAAWAVMALPILLAHAFIYWRRWKNALTPVRWLYLAVILSAVVMLLVALGLSASRGALLGLGVALLLVVVVVAARRGNRRFLWGTAAFAALAMVMYAGISTQVNSQSNSGLARLFRPYDAFRLEAWDAAATVLDQQGDALTDAASEPDPYVGLRRVIGYGVESVGQTQSRFGAIETYGRGTVFLNSFHNLIFDALVTQGVVGLSAWLMIFGGAVFVGLRGLDLLPQGSSSMLLISVGGGGVIGVGLFKLLVPEGELSALMPAGVALGAVLGLLAWPLILVLRNIEQISENNLTEHHIWWMALLSVVVIHWIDLQFGFGTAAADPLWWVLLGLMIGSSQLTEADLRDETEPQLWAVATLSAGTVLILSLGTSLHSLLLTHSIGEGQFPVLMAALIVVGGLGMLASREFRHIPVRFVVVIPLVWGMFALLKSGINDIAGEALDNALLDDVPQKISGTYMLLGMKGVVMALVVVMAWALIYGRPRLTPLAVVFTVTAFVLGSIFYMSNYAGTTLHSIANTLSSTDQAPYMTMADVTYESASDYQPHNSRLYLDAAFNRVKLNRLSAQVTDDETDDRLAELFDLDPYIIHTWEWTVFEQQAAKVRGDTS